MIDYKLKVSGENMYVAKVNTIQYNTIQYNRNTLNFLNIFNFKHNEISIAIIKKIFLLNKFPKFLLGFLRAIFNKLSLESPNFYLKLENIIISKIIFNKKI